MLTFEKHGKGCYPLEKLAAEVRLAIGTGGFSKETEVWGFRAREDDCSSGDIVKEVRIKRHS